MGRPKGSKNKEDKGVYLNCIYCDKIFRVRFYRRDIAKFCSRSCNAKYNYNYFLSRGFTMEGKESWNKKYKDKRTMKRICNRNLLLKNLSYKLSQYFQIYVRQSLKSRRTDKKLFEVLEYTIDDLKKHLEAKFTIGMNWGNYGRYGWHIDHKIPISHFNYSTIEDKEFKKCWSLENLQPLWAKENLKKHNSR